MAKLFTVKAMIDDEIRVYPKLFHHDATELKFKLLAAYSATEIDIYEDGETSLPVSLDYEKLFREGFGPDDKEGIIDKYDCSEDEAERACRALAAMEMA